MSDYKIPAGWLRAVDEALVAAHLGTASESDDFETARKKLNALIDWHVQVALDPAVNGGRQLVPVEPTPEMLAAVSWPKCATVDYRHMLAAAPTPPVHDENTSQERVRNRAENEHEPDLWVWQYSNGTFRCELNTLPNLPGQPVALYLHPPTLRMPEPMTDAEIFAAAEHESRFLSSARAIEAETLRRVREANK